jgi:hypothetical protein
MPIAINGSGTLTGISTGGISDTKAIATAAQPAGTVVKTSYVSTATFSTTTSTSYVDITNLTVNHTPLSSSNKLLIVAHIQNLVIVNPGYEGSIGLNILKDSTEIAGIELRSKDYGYTSLSVSGMRNCTTGIVDAFITAGTTNQITFKCQNKMINGALIEINPGNQGGGTDSDQSSIIIYEIVA